VTVLSAFVTALIVWLTDEEESYPGKLELDLIKLGYVFPVVPPDTRTNNYGQVVFVTNRLSAEFSVRNSSATPIKWFRIQVNFRDLKGHEVAKCVVADFDLQAWESRFVERWVENATRENMQLWQSERHCEVYLGGASSNMLARYNVSTKTTSRRGVSVTTANLEPDVLRLRLKGIVDSHALEPPQLSTNRDGTITVRTNLTVAEFFVSNESGNFVSSFEIEVSFVDSWGKVITTCDIATSGLPSSRKLRAIKPYEVVAVHAWTWNYNREKIASWIPASAPVVYIQRKEGNSTQGHYAAVSAP